MTYYVVMQYVGGTSHQFHCAGVSLEAGKPTFLDDQGRIILDLYEYNNRVVYSITVYPQ